MAESFINIYDNAVRSLVFDRWLEFISISDLNKDTIIWPKDTALRKIAEKRGKVDSEFISIWSYPQRDIDREHTPLALRGFTITSEDGTSQVIKSVPVQLNYGITVWSLSKDKLNKIAENYIWWKYRNPNMDLLVNGEIPLGLDLHFGEIMDDSPVEREYSQGLYFRLTFPLKLDAVLLETEVVGLIQSVQLKITKGYSPDTDPVFLDVMLEDT